MGSPVTLAITEAQKTMLIAALAGLTDRWNHNTRTWYLLQEKGWMKDGKLTKQGKLLATFLMGEP